MSYDKTQICEPTSKKTIGTQTQGGLGNNNTTEKCRCAQPLAEENN